MRATLRQNGKYMITTRTTHDIDGRFIASVLASFLWGNKTSFGEELVRISKTEIEQQVRSVLSSQGTDWVVWWSESWPEEHLDAAWAWAKDQVQHAWPEMTDTDFGESR